MNKDKFALNIQQNNNPKIKNYLGVGDSGSTGHYIKIDHSTALKNVRPTKKGITVFLPDGKSIKSTHIGELDWPEVPKSARIAHIFPELKGSLISIGLLCENRLIAKFTDNTLEISNHKGRTIMQGTRCPITKMWLLPLSHECETATEQNFVAQILHETDEPPNLVEDETDEEDPPMESTDDPENPDSIEPIQPPESKQFNEEFKRFRELIKDSAELKCFNAMVESGFQPNWAMSVQPRRSQQELVNFYHACFGSPTIAGFIEMVKSGIILPGLTVSMIRKFPPHTEETAIGHLDLKPWRRPDVPKPTPTDPSEPKEEDWTDDCTKGRITCLRPFAADEMYRNHTDLLGQFPHISESGNAYIMIQYSVDANYIHLELMKDRTDLSYCTAYLDGYEFFKQKGLAPILERIDNETSKLFQKMCAERNIKLELVPPGNHRGNKAERMARTSKNHFLSELATTDPNFPLGAWDVLKDHWECTLNLMRRSRLKPALSAWEHLHGPFDFKKTPIAPPGCKAVIHERANERKSWASHGKRGFYVGPAPNHVKCHRVYVTSTKGIRTSDTVEFFPHKTTLPKPSKIELIATAIDQLDECIKDLRKNIRIPQEQSTLIMDPLINRAKDLADLGGLFNDSQRMPEEQTQGLQRVAPHLTINDHGSAPLVNLADGRNSQIESNHTIADLGFHEHPDSRLQRVETGSGEAGPQDGAPKHRQPFFAEGNKRGKVQFLIPQIAKRSVKPDDNRFNSLLDDMEKDPQESPGFPTDTLPPVDTYELASHLPPNTGTKRKKKSRQAQDDPCFTSDTTDSITLPTATTSRSGRPRKPNSRHANWAKQDKSVQDRHLYKSPYSPPSSKQKHRRTEARYNPDLDHQTDWFANHIVAFADTDTTALNLDETGEILTYKNAMRGPDRLNWELAAGEEIIRLKTSGTIQFITEDQKPKDRKASYYNPQVKKKSTEEGIKYRVRGTYGGDRCDYEGVKTSQTASLEVLKCELNAVVTEGAYWTTADIENYYLGTTLPRTEYMRINARDIPEAIARLYNLDLSKGYVLTAVHKGIYGLPHAGKLAHDELNIHLSKHGYEESQNTPCLYRHRTRDIQFMLVVDDFGIKYTKIDDVKHLFSALRTKYKITIDWEGHKYLGITINNDRPNKKITITMPAYIQDALQRFGVTEADHDTDSPEAYEPPSYGAKVQYTSPDNSDPIDGPRVKRIQQVIGVLLYYARAVDETMLCTLNRLASRQATPTVHLERAIDRLLQYAATWPDAGITYRPSDMTLYIHSDGSYLSETRSRSRAGGHFYLGKKDDKGFATVNGSIGALSTIIPTVTASAAETEYASLFVNGQKGTMYQKILHDMGYPQLKTKITCDNLCAVGIATDTVKQKRSKAIDMRYNWIKDRVKQGYFDVVWAPGKSNLADFFTKVHPVTHFLEMRPFYCSDTPAAIEKTNYKINKRAERTSAYKSTKTSRSERTARGCVGDTNIIS